MNPFVFWRRKQRTSVPKRPRHKAAKLTFDSLERRDLMAGIPQLSSLPGAAHTIFLDFDGHFQTSWNRTDSAQTYSQINVGEFNIDGMAGISDYESASIRTIWETVADDYAPFNVNVTTVAPANMANTVRVVMAGSTSAVLHNSQGQNMLLPTRDVFISFDNGDMVDTSGYASVGSYTDAEPNVVFVFAKYMSTWNTTDSEGRYRDLRLIIATTASHEAGHAFGLEHHGNYDTGNSVTTPIMGSNTQGDRSVWSSYYVGSTLVDSRAHLTNLLGARPDDYTGSVNAAQNFPLTYSPLRGYSGTVKGVISSTNDADVFRLNTSATNTYRFTVSVPQYGNLDSQMVIYRVRTIGWLGSTFLEQVAIVDPGISAYNPYVGLGGTIDVQLPAGNYAVAVRSHGEYGDIGSYSLTVSIPSSGSVYYPANVGVYVMASEPTPPNPLPPVTTNNTGTVVTTKSGAGTTVDSPPTQSVDTPASLNREMQLEKVRKKTRQDAVDEVFAGW